MLFWIEFLIGLYLDNIEIFVTILFSKDLFIEKVTKHSSVLLLRLVTFSMNKSLDGQFEYTSSVRQLSCNAEILD